MAGLDPAIHVNTETDFQMEGRLRGGHDGKARQKMFSSLNQRAALQARVLTSDGGGGFAESWQTFAQVWVKIVPASATDTATAGRRESKARHRILLRRRSDLAAGQLVIVGARIFKVQGVLDAGPHAPLVTLLCEELPC